MAYGWGGGGHSHEHGTADQNEKAEAVLVRKERVPDADHVRKQELLGKQQREPAEGEVLGLDVLLLLQGERGTVRGVLECLCNVHL